MRGPDGSHCVHGVKLNEACYRCLSKFRVLGLREMPDDEAPHSRWWRNHVKLCSVCKDRGWFVSPDTGSGVDCPRCRPIDRAPTNEPESRYRRGMSLAEVAAAEGGPALAFTLTEDEPEFIIRRRHDDLDRLKVARWQGGAWGCCVGVLAAVAVIEFVKWVGL